MAQTVGMVMTDEGVETEEQLTSLRASGCQGAQGYSLSRPKPATEYGSSFRYSRLKGLALDETKAGERKDTPGHFEAIICRPEQSIKPSSPKA
jgi:predicted signal transduction protein with EAL and GGDEF domain